MLHWASVSNPSNGERNPNFSGQRWGVSNSWLTWCPRVCDTGCCLLEGQCLWLGYFRCHLSKAHICWKDKILLVVRKEYFKKIFLKKSSYTCCKVSLILSVWLNGFLHMYTLMWPPLRSQCRTFLTSQGAWSFFFFMSYLRQWRASQRKNWNKDITGLVEFWFFVHITKVTLGSDHRAGIG